MDEARAPHERRVAHLPMAVTADDLRERWPDLRDIVVVGVDLGAVDLDWSGALVEGTSFLRCPLPPGLAEQLLHRGAVVFPLWTGFPFEPYRTDLYTYEELTAGHELGAGATVDARIAAWFARPRPSVTALLARAVHDATIEAAVARFVFGRRIVGVMGGHALGRDDDRYRRVAGLGRALTRAGFTVATGGGPGVMEAANLGAWCAPFADDVLDAALLVLGRVPSSAPDPDGYVRAAIEVRTRWPAGGVSLGVPTWVYADEPTAAFASHIAKYFTNSVREDGLLAIARSGVVYAPGGPGTEQEIFTDTAQNSLTLYEVRSPMVFFGTRHFTADRPELLAAARHQASAFGWAGLVTVTDDVDAVVAFVGAHDPDASGGGGIERRRSHQGRT
jgi:predicted Rossmann-fold nucleotide-binding protein